MLAIFVGVRAEHNAADRRIEILERRQLNNGYVLSRDTFRDNPVLVCRTGLGEERVKGIADEIIHEHPVSAILSARMASAIPANLRVGDLAFCLHSMLHRSGEDIIHQPRGEVDRRLLELGGRAATSAGVPHVVGDCLTLAPLRPVPMNRELAGEVGNVVVVDTEGYWLAETAFEHQVPFLSVRVSLGEVYDRLPESLTMVGKRSYVSAWSMLRQNVVHPTRLPSFLRLVDAVRVSCRSLSGFFWGFFAEWEQHPQPSRSADQR
jgi:Phosphorylase superfamily